MRTKQITIGMVVLVVLLLAGLVGMAYVGKQTLESQSKKLTDLRAKNQSLSKQKVALVQAKKDIEINSDLNEITKSIVPKDKDQAKTVIEINRLAKEAGISLQQIRFELSTLGDKKPAPKTDPGETPEATTEAAPAAPKITQVAPVPGISGVLTLPIQVDSDIRKPVPFSRLVSFLNKLEQNRRTAHVQSINILPDSESPSLLSFKITLNAYLKQ